MARPVARRSPAAALPDWIAPQLSQLVDAPPEGPEWLHEIKFDGYRCTPGWIGHGASADAHRARLDAQYPAIASAVALLGATQAYLDGELCDAR
jgi:ATP-dependent DNA ligase